jgi:glycosyltransferase involved in cell wall biosynthesis
MKIAVIDHIGNPGGGSRVVRALLPALKRIDPSIEIEYFGNPVAIRRENLYQEFRLEGIKVNFLKSLYLSSGELIKSKIFCKALSVIQNRFKDKIGFLPTFLSGDVALEIEKRIQGFDLAFFPWPYMLRMPILDCPVVGIFHDFNFKYYFSGPDTFGPHRRKKIESEMPDWLAHSTPVVSTHFMASELKRFYPTASNKVKVIHLSSLGGFEILTVLQVSDILAELGIQPPYILYPMNMCSHKNVGPLIAAVDILGMQGRNIPLVLTGQGTENISGKSSSIGVCRDGLEIDVIGLGHVSNLQMNALIQGAKIVVSSSLYEAGNGPGTDAWARGVPVAMSNIPAFLEHIKKQDLRAKVFDPRDPKDIAKKLSEILDNPTAAHIDATHSAKMIAAFPWEKTARQYFDVFLEAIAQFNNPNKV